MCLKVFHVQLQLSRNVVVVVWGCGDMHLYASTAATHMQDDLRSKKCKKKKVSNVSSTAITKIQGATKHKSKPRLKRRRKLEMLTQRNFPDFRREFVFVDPPMRLSMPPPPFERITIIRE